MERGFEGFVDSFALGYAITVIRAITGDVSGGTPVPALTNAVARICLKPAVAVLARCLELAGKVGLVGRFPVRRLTQAPTRM